MSAGSHETQVLVIGGGQAGLAAAHHLTAAGLDHVVVDQHDRLGEAWRRRWDSVRLFTPAGFSHLPGAPLRCADPTAPTKDELADHLEQYARDDGADVRLGVRVERAERLQGGRFRTHSDRGTWHSDHLVVASGSHGSPFLPAVADDLSGDVPTLHAHAYRRPSEVPCGDVLVVGAGNSGAEIALDLARDGRPVTLAGPDVGQVPRLGPRTFELMQGLGGLGAAISRRLLGDRADPLGRVRPQDLDQAGVRRAPRIASASGHRLTDTDGVVHRPDVVVWATGYRTDHLGWLDVDVLDEDGRPAHRGGVALADPDVCFLGLPYQRSITSHLVGGVGADAAAIARHLHRRARH